MGFFSLLQESFLPELFGPEPNFSGITSLILPGLNNIFLSSKRLQTATPLFRDEL